MPSVTNLSGSDGDYIEPKDSLRELSPSENISSNDGDYIEPKDGFRELASSETNLSERDGDYIEPKDGESLFYVLLLSWH